MNRWSKSLLADATRGRSCEWRMLEQDDRESERVEVCPDEMTAELGGGEAPTGSQTVEGRREQGGPGIG
jgi:hypothetical protein